MSWSPPCPVCGSVQMDRIEVDIGIGIQCGPWRCYDCFYREEGTQEEYRLGVLLHCWSVFADKVRNLA